MFIKKIMNTEEKIYGIKKILISNLLMKLSWSIIGRKIKKNTMSFIVVPDTKIVAMWPFFFVLK